MHDRGARRPALLTPESTCARARALREAAAARGTSQRTEVTLRTVPFAATGADADTVTRLLLATALGRRVGADLMVAP
ncbi:hypothetical protein ABZY81_13715 [Streptomyces sp. NPDC006514]|uniref:hypothetical protein n=1 Tax=Streptomyces sp. NPDC006514 TaxID=3154308 RepID=UPI0033B4D4C3